MSTPASENYLPGALAEISERFRLIAIYAFGSRAQEVADRTLGQEPDDARPGSDVDIGVVPERGCRISVRDKVRLAIALEDLYGVDRVDLVAVPEANAFLARDIVIGELLHARDPRAEARYQLYVMRRAADLLPYAQKCVDEWLAGASVVT